MALTLSDAIEKLEQVAFSEHRLPTLREAARQNKSLAWDDFSKLTHWLKLTRTLYDTHRLNKAEYIFYSCSRIEDVHSKRWFAGEFRKLNPIRKKIRAIEKAHGLKNGESWHAHEGPKEWNRLNDTYGEILDQYYYEALLEFELSEIAALWKTDRAEYDKLREKGRRSVFHKGEPIAALKEVISCYGREAQLAASVQAYSAAITLLGAGLEGILLLRCLRSPAKANRIAKTLRKNAKTQFVNEPTKWSFDTLIEVCLKAGWLPTIESRNAIFKTSGMAHALREVRNLVHPGKIIRERPWSELGESEYKFCEAIFVTLLSIVNKIRKGPRIGGP